ncbi:MAG TPA: hypothetical protein VGV67_06690 [Solirubrobacteraceae bacterium]|nr:hypothetical protein [Solirubrobacteraceae bacterium]
MPIIAALVLAGCLFLTWLILRGRQGRSEREHERPVEVDEALERMREWVRRPGTVVSGAVIVALLLIAALARNPSRWAVLLLALGVLAAGTASYVVVARRRRRGG